MQSVKEFLVLGIVEENSTVPLASFLEMTVATICQLNNLDYRTTASRFSILMQLAKLMKPSFHKIK